jgi:glycosyltransferase
MKVSIITIVYNSQETLEQTIKSVLNQTYNNIEYIIIDGGSTDGSVDIIKKYEDHIAHWSSEADKGISDAFNKGLRYATGTLIGLINADDWYEIDAVETIVQNYSDAYGVYCGNMSMIDAEGNVEKIRKSNYNRLSLGMYIMHPTTFVKKEIYDCVGTFSDEYKLAMDYDLMLRIDKAGYRFLCINHKIACMRVGGVSCDVKSSNKEALAIIKKHYPAIVFLRAKIFTFLNRIRMFLLT